MAKKNQLTWQTAAACKDVPSYIFFPEETILPKFTPDPNFTGKSFRDFCGSCPVKWKCREFANLHDEKGIWGEQTEPQRRKHCPTEERWEMRDEKELDGEYWPLYGHS